MRSKKCSMCGFTLKPVNAKRLKRLSWSSKFHFSPRKLCPRGLLFSAATAVKVISNLSPNAATNCCQRNAIAFPICRTPNRTRTRFLYDYQHCEQMGIHICSQLMMKKCRTP
ncbi:hypothetical protein AVEN_218865-1 [Araneus ventricosus]|uniref:Uncharacterized protein n=1 Tax=Araneus ventricosus TaxID=182803 RepID=A0A4Y2EWH6_ARAVE|nr:hypothetical protein AVEN_198667-1 [Araneus ventricosus]GBM32575.1 hypothetical protein AVEN_218865-1 [Araneus ventricosus]